MSWRDTFKEAYKNWLPDSLLVKIDQRINNRNYGAVLKDLSRFYEQSAPPGSQDMKDLYHFIRNNGLCVFPYEFSREYLTRSVALHFDKEQQIPYVLHEGKKLYFPASMAPYDIRRLYRSLLLEQDHRSPHAYSHPAFQIQKNARVLDLGAAEGIWVLQNIDNIQKAVLVEADPSWGKALEATFQPYGDKVTILQKYAGAATDEKTITVPDLFERYGTFDNVKMDIEGMELEIVATMKDWNDALFDSTRYAICTYHRQDDAEAIAKALPSSLKYQFSDGFTFFFYDKNQKPPYFRKTLVFVSR